MEIRRRLPRQDRSKLADALIGLAGAYAAQRKSSLAEPHYAEALEVLLEAPDASPEAVATCRRELEALARLRGDP